MFTIEMLPAEQGDCLWIEYGDTPRPKKILIDAGTKSTFKILIDRFNSLRPGEREFELFIMTHYDDDHLDGILDLQGTASTIVRFKDVWFNGWRHIHKPPKGILGPLEGETFTNIILSNGWPWNKAFKGESIFIMPDSNLPVIELDGELKLTLLSPTPAKIASLKKNWQDRLKDQGIEPGVGEKGPFPSDILGKVKINERDVLKLAEKKFSPDASPANGSSIAVLAEYDGKRALLTGDANTEVLLKSIQKLTGQGKKLKLDLFKVSHHGSKYNISGNLVQSIDCSQFFISTNGYKHGHPNDEAIAKIIALGGKPAHLCFNYKTEFNKKWDDASLKNKFGYKTSYGRAGFLKIDL